MWFIVAEFLVVCAVRCAVISSFISVCSVLNCDDAQHFRFWFQTITTSEIAQLGRVTETTHIEPAICAVQGSFWADGKCRCGQESHTSTVLRQVMESVSFGRFVTVIHCRGGQGKSRVHWEVYENKRSDFFLLSIF